MNFLSKLFGGGRPRELDGRNFYVYIQPKMCKEIVEVRVDLYSELSQTDDEKGYYVRKIATAIRCPFQAEVELHFDSKRRLTAEVVTNGTRVDKAAYEAYLAKKD